MITVGRSVHVRVVDTAVVVRLGQDPVAVQAAPLVVVALRVPGRLTYYARMGAEHVRELLPPLLRAMRDEGHPILWASDPMHGNGIRTASGVKLF